MEEYIKVSEMARLLGISTYMLRKYESEGTFIPHHVDEKNGYRYYTRSQYEEFLQRRKGSG